MYFPARHSRRPRLLALSLLTLSLLMGLIAPAASARPDEPVNQADVVVDFGNGRSLTRHITFPEPSITGIQALQLTGLQLTTVDYSFGTAVCAIEDVGCPATNCFCDANRYWGYQFWDGAAWQGYMVGAGASTVENNAVEGWTWGAFGSHPPAITPEILSANAALQWIRPQQQANGSIGNNVGATLDVILAVAAANQSPSAWRSAAGYSLVDYVAQNAAAFAAQSAAAAGKLAAGAAAAGQDPQDFGGLNLINAINSTYNLATGAFGANNQDQAWAMLGLRSAGAPVTTAAIQHLGSLANADGGWGWTGAVPSDVDSTAIALQALIAAEEPANAAAVVDGLDFLRAVQLTNDDGGFAHSPDMPWAQDSNTNSTAFAVQAIIAVGQDPLTNTWSISATTAIDFIHGQQEPGGAFVYVDPPANLFATQQAVSALVGKAFPLASPAVALRRGVDWIADQQQPDGSFAGFNPGATIDAVVAIAAAGQNPNDFSAGGNTPLTYLAAQAPAYATQGVSAAGKLAVGAAAGRRNPRNFGGVNLVTTIEAAYQPATGQYGGGTTWDQAFAILGLIAANAPAPMHAVHYLSDIASDGGGWGFTANAASPDVDSTALALQALAAARVGLDDEAVQGGLDFLRASQNGDGGFPGYSGDTDPASTGGALQALAAFNQDPHSLAWTTTVTDGSASALTLHTPVDALLALQSDEGGFPGYSGPNDPFSTYQGLAGVAFKPLPVRQPIRRYLPFTPLH